MDSPAYIDDDIILRLANVFAALRDDAQLQKDALEAPGMVADSLQLYGSAREAFIAGLRTIIAHYPVHFWFH